MHMIYKSGDYHYKKLLEKIACRFLFFMAFSSKRIVFFAHYFVEKIDE